MTAKLDVMPKTTEQNRIVRTGKFEAEVTNNKKKLRSRYCTIEVTKLTTDKHEASRGLFAAAELLVIKTAEIRHCLVLKLHWCYADLHGIRQIVTTSA